MFRLENLEIEINITERKSQSQTSENDIDININSKNKDFPSTSFRFGSDDGNDILPELYNFVQENGNDADTAELQRFQKYIRESVKGILINNLNLYIESRSQLHNSVTNTLNLYLESRAQFQKSVMEYIMQDDDVRTSDETRSHITGMLDGINFEYTGPAPELRRFMVGNRRGQTRYPEFFIPDVVEFPRLANPAKPVHSTSDTAPGDKAPPSSKPF
jgi:hypothetical protein